jgi:GGDEF domain-containing protein
MSLKVGALLDEQTAGSAVIAERDGHFLLLLPEAGRQEAERVAKRLEQVAADRHGIDLRFGIASFPHQEITFDKLLETAETDLRAIERQAAGGDAQREGTPQAGSSAPART